MKHRCCFRNDQHEVTLAGSQFFVWLRVHFGASSSPPILRARRIAALLCSNTPCTQAHVSHRRHAHPPLLELLASNLVHELVRRLDSVADGLHKMLNGRGRRGPAFQHKMHHINAPTSHSYYTELHNPTADVRFRLVEFDTIP